MADTNSGAGSAPAQKVYSVKLGKSVRFEGVWLSPKDGVFTVTAEALVELGDAVIEKVEVNGAAV